MANKRLNAIITIGGTVTGALKNALGSTQRQLRDLGGTIKGLEKDQKALGKAMRDAMQTNSPVGELHRDYERLGREIDRARGKQERMNRAMGHMDSGRDMMGRGGMMIGAAAAAGAAATVPVVHAAQFEKAMLGVAKQVDGARDSSGKLTQVYYQMGKEIQKLARDVPVAANDIAAMVEAGARMGVARDELIAFTKTAIEMSVALELPVEELSENMGKIAGLYKIPIPAIGELADKINYLDDNAISKGGDIIDFLTRTGGVAGAVKITGNEMAALGSTLLTLGERTETAGTATNAMIQKFAAADKGTKKMRGALSALGLSAEAVRDGMQVDAQGTILRVLDAVNKLPTNARIGVLTDLIGLEHSDTLAKLAVNVDEYRRQIDLVNNQKAEGSVGREFEAQLESTTAQWQILKNRQLEFSVAMGSVLLPTVNKVMGVLGKVALKMAEWSEEHPTLTKNIIVIGGVIGGLVMALGIATVAVGAFKFAFGAMSLAIITNPIGLAIAGIALGAALIIANWEPIKGFFVGLFGDIKATVGKAIDWMLAKISVVGDAWRSTKAFFGFGDEQAAGRAPPPAPRVASGRGSVAVNDNSQTTFNITGSDPRAVADEVERRQRQRQAGRSNGALFDTARGY